MANMRDQGKARAAVAALQDLRREYEDAIAVEVDVQAVEAVTDTAADTATTDDELALEDDVERLMANELDTGENFH